MGVRTLWCPIEFPVLSKTRTSVLEGSYFSPLLLLPSARLLSRLASPRLPCRCVWVGRWGRVAVLCFLVKAMLGLAVAMLVLNSFRSGRIGSSISCLPILPTVFVTPLRKKTILFIPLLLLPLPFRQVRQLQGQGPRSDYYHKGPCMVAEPTA